MRGLGRSAIHTALGGALIATSSWAQDNPGLSVKPSGRSLDGRDHLAEQPVDLTRPNPQRAALPKLADYLYFDAATRGEAWAQTRLGKFYIEQSGDPELQRKGVELLQRAAEQKDAEAIYLLARASAASSGTNFSNVGALQKLQEAAEMGNAEAQYELATIYAAGLGGSPKDLGLAMHWGKKAAAQGNTRALFSVGRTLIESGPEERAKGLEYLHLAAKAKDSKVAAFLAAVLVRGEFGVTKDEPAAEAVLRPLAEAGDPECQFALASLYRFGERFAHKRKETKLWLRRAADQGHPEALKILAAGDY